MKRRIDFETILQLATLVTMLLSLSVSVMGQQQPPTVTRPSASSVHVTPRGTASPLGSATNATTGMKPAVGAITGFVYWQMNVFQPQADCQGLTVKVITVNNSGMPLQLLSTTSALTASGPLTDYSATGTPKYMLCSYSFHNMPEEVSLRALLYGMPSSASVATPSAFQIPGGNCNSGPSSTLSFILTGGPMLCGHGAYNINFKLTGSPSAIARSPQKSTLIPNAGGPPHGLLEQPGAQNSNVGSPTSAATGGPTLLTSAPGTGSPTPSNNGTPQKKGGQVTAGATDLARQSAAGTTPGATSQTLTNADVAKMLEAGLAESVIISSIRSARKNFDFSPAGCQTLKRARVSVSILDAMGDGSRRPCGEITGNSPSATPGSKVELNPQPLPPGSKAAPANRTALKPIKLAPPKALRKMTNPRLAEQNASVIAILQQQRAAAQEEGAAMKLGTRAVASAASVHAPVSTTFQGGTTVQNLGPETTQSEKGNLASRVVHAPGFHSIVLLCADDPTPRIIQLSGGEGHGILTPEAKYNLYTITGCSFGPSRTGNSAYITSGSYFKATLNIDSWAENGITSHLDPWLSGVPDRDNVTLVVAPALGQPIQQPGFKFYAARGMPHIPDNTPEEIPLAYNSVPQGDVTLSKVTDVQVGWDGLPSNATSAFPSFSFQGTQVAGWVFRYAYGHTDQAHVGNTGDYDCWINGEIAIEMFDKEWDCSTYFSRRNIWDANLWDRIGTDLWWVSLAPDFVISSYQLYYEDTDPSQICGAWDDSSKDSGHVGNWWDFSLTDTNQITVSWPLYWCFDQEAWPFNRVNAMRQSAYGLAVWVWGPRCIDPLNGQPDQACMNQVKKIYGG